MPVEISVKKGTSNPTSSSGLTLGEPAFNYANNTLWMGKGSGASPVWVGAGVCGASGGIAAGLTTQLPTHAAVKNYFDAVSSSFLGATASRVTFLNGISGGITLNAGTNITITSSAAGGITIDSSGGGGGGAVSSVSGSGNGISVSPTTGAVIVSNTGVHSFNGIAGAVTGVCAAAAGTGIAVSGSTGTVTITNIGVQTFNGLTGAVTGASLGANTFTALNSFNAGISAAGGTFSALTRFTAGITASTVTTSTINPPSSSTTLNINSGGAQTAINSSIVKMGDYNGVGGNVYLTVDDTNGAITVNGPTTINGGTTTIPIILNTGNLSRNYTVDADTRTQTSSTTANQTILSIPVGDPNTPNSGDVFGIELTIMASDTTVSNKHEIVRMLVTHDFTNTFNTQYGVTRTGTALATYTTTLTGTTNKNLALRVSPTSANLTSFVVLYRAYAR